MILAMFVTYIIVFIYMFYIIVGQTVLCKNIVL